MSALSSRRALHLSRSLAGLQTRCFTCSTRRLSQQSSPSSSSSSSSTSTSSSNSQNKSTVDFGFETISESLKNARVGAVFSSVASSYDTMNDLMSLGIHRLWKDHFVRSLNPGARATGNPLAKDTEDAGWNILDVAGGTGDIAFRMLDHATTINRSHNTKVIISDINAEMLAEGHKRSLATPYARTDRVSFLEANAENLEKIPSNSVDLYTVAFGIRNMTHKDIALREAFRVLKPGGAFACLEFSKVENSLMNAVYKRWSFGAIPLIGQLVAGDRDSYQYLVESIEKFPSQAEFAGMIRDAGFLVSEGNGWEDLSGGIAAIHKGVKPAR